MTATLENPWNVSTLEEFLYFCCPECDLRDQSKMNFLHHALEQHPKAKEYLKQFNELLVKEEPDEDHNDKSISETFENSYNLGTDYSEMLKCEVKVENKDNDNTLDMENEFDNISKNVSRNSKTCKHCGKEYKSNQKLRQHIERDHEGIRHKCNLCAKSFSLAGSLQSHKRTVHSDKIIPTEYEINLEVGKKNEEVLIGLVEKSDLYKFSKNTLNRTLIWEAITDQYNALTGNELDWKGVSQRWTKHLQKLKTAAEKNPKESNGEVKCDICSETFSEKDVLADHMKKFHPHAEYTPKKLKRECHICKISFRNKPDFENHYKEIHQIFSMYQCELCPKTYEKRDSLTNHINWAHTKNYNTSVVCDLCGKTYSCYISLRKHHKTIHEGKKDHVCEFCNRAFSESKDLKNHIKCVHEKIKDQVCDLCGQSFVNRWALKNHIKNIHEGIKDHVCKLCGKAFSTGSKLNEHTRSIHEGLKPHKCLHCDRCFPNRSKLKVHMKSVHRNIDLELL